MNSWKNAVCREDPVRPRQALDQNIVVCRIKGGREIEQSVVVGINRFSEVGHYLQESGLGRVPTYGRPTDGPAEGLPTTGNQSTGN